MKPRERQSVWCCDSNYQRWRFLGREFPNTHQTHCVHCGQELVWPESRVRAMSPDQRAEHQRKIWLAGQRRLVARRAEQGLTSRGHRPLRRSPVLNEVERAWRAERSAMGVIEIADPIAGCLRYGEGPRNGRWKRS
jgi:hypothetical protein